MHIVTNGSLGSHCKQNFELKFKKTPFIDFNDDLVPKLYMF